MSDDSVLDVLDALIAGLGQENRQDEDKHIVYNNSLEPENQIQNPKQAITRNHAVDDEKFRQTA